MSKEKVVSELICWGCREAPPNNLSGGNRYRWMYLHIAEHFKKGELYITVGVDVKREVLYLQEALQLSVDAGNELIKKLTEASKSSKTSKTQEG